METNFEFKSVTVTNDLDGSNNRIVATTFSDGNEEKTITLSGIGNIKEVVKV